MQQDVPWLIKLEKICPRQKNIFKRNKRNKREPISIGIVIVALIASAGVGIGAWGVTRTYAIETKEEELKQALDELEKRVFSGEKRIEFLQDEVRKVTSILDQLVADFTLHREKVVELQYLIAYLTGNSWKGEKPFMRQRSHGKRESSTQTFLIF
jgi:cell division protein FtsB